MNTEMMKDEKQNEYFKIFESEEFGKLEILVMNELMYFPATEIAETLEHKNPHKAIRDHCRQDYPHLTIRSVGVITGKKKDGSDSVQFVNKKYIDEGNLYRLIVKSKLEVAIRFENWIFDEVLPTIRRTGSYVNTADIRFYENSMQFREKELEIAERKERNRTSEILKELADIVVNEKMKNTLVIASANSLFDKPVLEYEKAKKPSYPASKIAEKLLEKYNISITVAMIGRLANRHGLKTDENGYLAYDKSKSSIKQVETFRYYDDVVPVLYDIILSDTKLKNKYIKE